MNKIKLLIPLLITGCGVTAWSQGKSAEAKALSQASMSGKELFQVYCAACHGMDGKGNGPVAPAMKTRIPDLTLLTKKAGGQFPLIKTERTIDGDAGPIAHGSRDMPVYGDLFRDIRRDDDFVKQRIALLTGYLESIQVR